MRRFFFVLLGMFVMMSVGCQTAPVKHYAIQAEVISVNVPEKMLTVKHGEIPGLMPAMTMNYLVADEKQIEPLKPGDKISCGSGGGGKRGAFGEDCAGGKSGAAAPAPAAAIRINTRIEQMRAGLVKRGLPGEIGADKLCSENTDGDGVRQNRSGWNGRG